MREAMKKAIILIVLAIAIPACLFAETSELSRKKVVLTAFKDLNTSSVPAEINYLKFYAATAEGDISSEVQNGGSVALKTIGEWETAFYWIIEGTAFQNVKLSFKFWPLYHGELSTMSSEIPPQNKVIPYQIQLQHVSSEINQVSISEANTAKTDLTTNNPHNPVLTVANSNNGTTDPLGFNYAEKVNYVSSNSAIKITPSADDAFYAEYDFSTYSYVARDNGYNQSTYDNSKVNVCNTWDRTGKALIKLLLTDSKWTEDDSIAVEKGDYSAFVIVTITIGS